MRTAAILLVIVIGWSAITGSFSLPNLLLGAAVGFIALYLVRPARTRLVAPGKIRRVAVLTGLFVYELFYSAIRVAILVMRPNLLSHLHPVIIAFPLTVKSNAEITLLANLITLTPGTLSVDVSADRRFLYVHALNCRDRDALVRELATGFERRVIEAFL